MTMDKVKQFVMDGRGGIITLQFTTLAAVFGLFYAGINWKRDIEDAMKNRWTSVHMELWRMQFAHQNPSVTVPKTQDIIELIGEN